MADLQRLRATTAEAGARAAELAGRESAAAASLAAARQAGDRDAVAAALANRRALGDERRTLQTDLSDSLRQILGQEIDLEGSVPLVLLPVRIEVRSTPDQRALRVRVFPDAVHVESLDPGISPDERAAAESYWRTVWADGDPAAPWPALQEAVGARRAPWVAEATRPENLADSPDGDLVFPATLPAEPRKAVVATLPDRFIVRIEQDGAEPVVRAGSAIPDPLPVGLTDAAQLDQLAVDDEDLPPLDAELRWLVDYDEAVTVGLAVTVPLPRPGRPVRRVLAYGVRAGLTASEGAARLEGLLRSHRFSDGAEFLEQGAPTNNTDTIRPEWSRRTPLGPPSLNPTEAGAIGSNGAVTAAALGVDPALVAALPKADDRQQARAAAFSRALWDSTWGGAIEHLTPQGRANGDKRLDSPRLDAVRDHWIGHVRGRGPLPALRIGRQPYGLLPIVGTGSDFRPLRGDFAEQAVTGFLSANRWLWEDAAGQVPTLMDGSLETVLPQILGTDAVLRGLRVRTAITPDPIFHGTASSYVGTIVDSFGQQASAALSLLTGVGEEAIEDNFLVAKKTRSLALPLVHDSDPEFVGNLLATPRRPLPARSVLQVLLAHADALSRHEQDKVASREALDSSIRIAVAESSLDVDRELVLAAVAAVAAGALDDGLVDEAARQLADRVGVLDRRVLADRNPLAALAPPTLVQQVAGYEVNNGLLTGVTGLQLVGEVLRQARSRAAFTEALRVIEAIDDLDERRLLLAETLDCCSHRLDAWLTSIASRRLADLRARSPQGAFLGAYGVIENIQLRSPVPDEPVDGRPVVRDQADGGFVHAPGLVHAATAGVLRSGRLAHRRGAASEALNIDLSSRRTRDALSLLDGIRRGQPLGALLGYRLERRLHDRSGKDPDPERPGGFVELDRFIYVLRTHAPLRLGKLTESGAPAQESLAANNVVDGLLLLERLGAGKFDLDDALHTEPADFAKYAGGRPWEGPTATEAAAVRAEIEALAQTHDAVADLLLAESVHQLVSGNPARAAAVLDVLGAGEADPPEPEIVTQPRSGLTVTHRVGVVLADPPPAGTAGWNPATPRALSEPRLELWAEHALGAATGLGVADGVTLADAGVSALDVLFDTDADLATDSTLLARLRAGFPELVPESAFDQTYALAGLLRGLLTAARPLTVADVGRPTQDRVPGQPAEVRPLGRQPDADEIVARAGTAVAGLRAALAPGVEVEGGPPADPLATLPALRDYGIRRPSRTTATGDEFEDLIAAEAMVADGLLRASAADRLLARAAATPPPSDTVRAELAGQALGQVFGAGFVAVPVLLPAPATESDLWSDAVGPGGVTDRPGADIRPWLQRAGSLRPAVSAFGELLLVREVSGSPANLRAVQTPAAGYGSWVGLPFPDARPPQVPLSSLVAEIAGDRDQDLSGAVAGLVVDEWTEVVPRRLERRNPSDPEGPPELVDVTTTGLAVHANAPGARPPQAILLAMTPDGGPWNAARLVDVIDEALALARLRGVTLEQIPFAGRYLPALYFNDWSLQGEPVIDWLKLEPWMTAEHALAYLKVEQ